MMNIYAEYCRDGEAVAAATANVSRYAVYLQSLAISPLMLPLLSHTLSRTSPFIHTHFYIYICRVEHCRDGTSVAAAAVGHVGHGGHGGHAKAVARMLTIYIEEAHAADEVQS